jgi:hypothetical protein
VSSAGLRTTVLPQASAGPSFQLAMFAGKFHGTMRPDDAERLAKRRSDAARDRDRLAAVLVHGSRVEVEDLRHHADLGAGARDRLADVPRLDPRELLRVLLYELRETAQQPRAVHRRDHSPAGERLLRSRDRLVRLFLAGLAELGDRLLRRGVEDGEGHRTTDGTA